MDPGHLPPTMETRFAELGRRIQRQQLAQGLCRVMLVLLGAAVAAVAADAFLDLSGTARTLLLIGWLSLGGIGFFLLLRRGLQRPDPAVLAATIEARFPRLAERLSTAVGLSGKLDAAHGSPFLVSLVVHDADVRTGKLDLNRAAPLKPTLIAIAVCGVASLAAAVPLFVLPSARYTPAVSLHPGTRRPSNSPLLCVSPPATRPWGWAKSRHFPRCSSRSGPTRRRRHPHSP